MFSLTLSLNQQPLQNPVSALPHFPFSTAKYYALTALPAVIAKEKEDMGDLGKVVLKGNIFWNNFPHFILQIKSTVDWNKKHQRKLGGVRK